MEISVKKARETIKRKCEENEKYIISKLEAYIMICDSVKEIVQLYVYEKLEEKIKSGKAVKEELMHICDMVFGKGNPINSIAENMLIKEGLQKSELEEYKDIFEDYKKINKKKC